MVGSEEEATTVEEREAIERLFEAHSVSHPKLNARLDLIVELGRHGDPMAEDVAQIHSDFRTCIATVHAKFSGRPHVIEFAHERRVALENMVANRVKGAMDFALAEQHSTIRQDVDIRLAEERISTNTRWLLLAHGATAAACLNAFTNAMGASFAGALLLALAGAIAGLFVAGLSSGLAAKSNELRGIARYGAKFPLRIVSILNRKGRRVDVRSDMNRATSFETFSHILAVASFMILIANLSVGTWQLWRANTPTVAPIH